MIPANQSIAQALHILRQVRHLSFTAQGEAATGWTGEGTGSVQVDEAPNHGIVFIESGTWRTPAQKSFKFSNTYRWSPLENALRLEHLRFGPDRPVLLFDLIPEETGRWINQTPHVCSEDCYAAILAMNDNRLSLSWSVKGPKKNESIAYVYY